MIILLFVVNLIAAGLWMKLVMSLDRHMFDKGGEKNYSAAFIAGLLSIVPALIFYELHPFAAALEDYDLFYHMLIVGPVEETAKFLTFAVLVKARRSVREPLDGMFQAAMVGLGFATVENITYFSHGLGTLLLRCFTGMAGHMAYAALWGFVWGAYFHDKAGSDPKAGIRGPNILFLFAAIIPSAVVHGAYNSLLGVDLAGVEFVLAMAFKVFLLAAAVKILGIFLRNSPYRAFLYAESAEAHAALTRGLKMYPESIVLRRRLGLHSMAAGRFAEAESAFHACAAKSTRPAQYRALEAAALIAGGDPEKGVPLLHKNAKKIPARRLRRMGRELRTILGPEVLAGEGFGVFMGEGEGNW